VYILTIPGKGARICFENRRGARCSSGLVCHSQLYFFFPLASQKCVHPDWFLDAYTTQRKKNISLLMSVRLSIRMVQLVSKLDGFLTKFEICVFFDYIYIYTYIYIYIERERERERESGLEVACWPLVPKFAGSNPAEAFGFLRAKKSSARLPSEGK